MKSVRAIVLIRKYIRRWWMQATAPNNLVRYKGGYFVLLDDKIAREVAAYPVRFSGLLGWEHDEVLPVIVFPSMQQARKKTIVAKYYIEVIE